MTNNAQDYVLLILFGILLTCIPLIRGASDRIGLPSLVGYIFLGLLLRLADYYFPFITPKMEANISFLAQIGVFVLLFQVGLKSNIKGLIDKLPTATVVWIGDVFVSFALGYLTARYLLDIALIPSVITATALSATSLAVTIGIWQERGETNSARAQLLVDVAELDDLSGVVLLAILLAVLPVMIDGQPGLWQAVGLTTAGIMLKLTLFIALCYCFAHFIEEKFTRFSLEWSQTKVGLTIGILGMGLAISALAGYFGFSLAIGALMVGLAFSRDRLAVRDKTRLQTLYSFFVPFFFIHIGLEIVPAAIVESFAIALPLILAAIAGKLIGVGLPVLLQSNRKNAILLSVSMVPRAEISMLIFIQVGMLDATLVPAELYSAMVVVVIVTAVFSPVALRRLGLN